MALPRNAVCRSVVWIVVFTDHTHLLFSFFCYTLVQIQCSKLPNYTGSHCRSRFALLHEDKDISLEVIKLEFILKLKIKCNDWLLADSQSLCFILSLRLY